MNKITIYNEVIILILLVIIFVCFSSGSSASETGFGGKWPGY